MRVSGRAVLIVSLLCLLSWIPVVSAQPGDRGKAELLKSLDTPMDALRPDVTQLRIGAGPVLFSRLDSASKGVNLGYAPYFSFQYRERLVIDGTQVRLNLIDRDTAIGAAGIRFGPMVNIDPGRGVLSSSGMSGIGRVGVSVEVGGFASYSVGSAQIRARVRRDVASGHSGTVADFDAQTGLFHSTWLDAGTQVATTWASRSYMRSFFGISSLQAMRSGLPLYDPGPGFKGVTFTLFAEHRVSRHWSVLAATQYTRLLGVAVDSPIIRLRGALDGINVGFFVIYTVSSR